MANHLHNIVSSEDKPQIYVACLASYTNGILYGEWLDATEEVEDIQEQIKQLLAKSSMPNAEEVAIHDYRGFGALSIGEYEDMEEVQEKAHFTLEHGELGAELAAYYGGNLEDTRTALEEHYQGEYKSELDYATYLFDEIYLHDVPKHIQGYIDYEQFCTDIFIGDYFSLDIKGSCHIFSRH
jgi:antirestriction protein